MQDGQREPAQAGVLEGEAQDRQGLGRPVGADEHAAPRLGTVLRTDDHDRARGPSGDLLAHRAEDDAQHVAPTARADHDQGSVRGDVEQRLTGVDRAHDLVHDELRMTGDDARGRPGQQGAGSGLEVGEHLHRVGPAEAAPRRTDGQGGADAVHQQEMAFLQSSLVGGPVEGPVGELGGVDAHDDAPGGQVLGLHASTLARSRGTGHGHSAPQGGT